jgi:hypothetical protein
MVSIPKGPLTRGPPRHNRPRLHVPIPDGPEAPINEEDRPGLDKRLAVPIPEGLKAPSTTSLCLLPLPWRTFRFPRGPRAPSTWDVVFYIRVSDPSVPTPKGAMSPLDSSGRPQGLLS